MEIYAYNIDGDHLTLDGLCEDWNELLWVRRFFKGDDFTIQLPPTEKNIKLFSVGKVIEVAKLHPVTGASEHGGIITAISISSGEKSALTISGKSFDGMLERRILADYTLGDTAMTIIRKNAGDLAKAKRRFGATVFDDTVDAAAYQAGQMLFKKLSDFTANIASAKGWGLQSKIVHDKSNVHIEIGGRQCVDRSISQADFGRVVFSDEYGTAADFERQQSENGSVTGVVVGSAKQYNENTHIDVEQSTNYFGDAQSYDRTESFQSISPVTKKEIRDKVEWEVLDDWGTFLVADELAAAEYVSATDYLDASIILKDDWEKKLAIGDTVTIQNTGWNVAVNKQVTEIREFFGADNVTLTATLGEPPKTLSEIFKKG